MPGRQPRHLVVAGNGMAGFRLVQEVLAADLDRRLVITVAGAEPGGAYNRIQLSHLLAGHCPADSIELAGPGWYRANGVRLRAPATVTRIDRPARLAWLDDGSVLPYDVLVLATGADPVLPPVDGLAGPHGRLLPGAVPFRTRADCAAIDRLARDAASAVVLGGGVLGLEAARALAGRGLPVTLVQRGRQLMERDLDAAAAAVLGRTVRGLGVRVHRGAGIAAVLGGTRLHAVRLDDGTVLDADLLVLCCGVRPRTELARAAGLAVGTGVVVDDQLRSSDPSIFAIGDCAEHRGRGYGLVAPAWEQAKVAAWGIARPSDLASYPGSVPVTRLKAAGVELACLGEAALTEDEADDAGGGASGATASDVEVVRFTDSARGVYQKLVVRSGRLAGAILLGDTAAAGTLAQLFDRGSALPADRAALLLGRTGGAAAGVSPTRLPGRATICHCNGVSKAAICAAWESGARRPAEIAAVTRATTGCGTCRDAVEGIVDWLSAADAEPEEGAGHAA